LTGLERKFPSPNQPRQYPDLIADFLHSEVKYSAAEVDDIMFNNAFRFLGLTKNDRAAGNRGRLEAFYADFGGDPSWMNALDTI